METKEINHTTVSYRTRYNLNDLNWYENHNCYNEEGDGNGGNSGDNDDDDSAGDHNENKGCSLKDVVMDRRREGQWGNIG